MRTMKRLRGHLTYANVVATLALFIAVGGGAAFAATKLAKNSVGSAQLKKNAVVTAKIKNKAVTGAKIDTAKLGTVPSATNATNSDKLGGVEASHYVTASSVLASGQTEVGVFAASAPTGAYASAVFNFSPKLPHSLLYEKVEVLSPGETTADCPGRGHAGPDRFCVYEAFVSGLNAPSFGYTDSGSDEAVVQPEGAVLIFPSTATTGTVRGNWAYTAP
jgi:hypothetical protein